ncbi:hypothetical protein GCM10009530_67390 [Microbispora corallina]|uniref:Uncharacterized protein n=1 Tax=Microbispora corallina TaxID=83302 RepID=A0ABQ4G9L2_9ACTN|nr:hypothetical protein [Microbispora corallina]GIH43740.1 hypothetical protein Mco01_67400 [Microbispora corallina]
MISKRMRAVLSAAVLGTALAGTLTASARADEGTPGPACPRAVKVVERDGKLLVDDGTGLREIKEGERVRAVPAVPAGKGVASAENGRPGDEGPSGADAAPVVPLEKGTSEDGDGPTARAGAAPGTPGGDGFTARTGAASGTADGPAERAGSASGTFTARTEAGPGTADGGVATAPDGGTAPRHTVAASAVPGTPGTIVTTCAVTPRAESSQATP